MVFSSAVFLFAFLPIALALVLLSPHFARNGLLLLLSLIFYAWGEAEIVFAMMGSILVNYVAGRCLEMRRGEEAGRKIVAFAVGCNLGLLVYFKYLGFFAASANALLSGLNLGALAVPQIALPIGISFFTFQGMSYVIDVYRGDADVQRNPLNFGMYIALFPQLIAGPIVRYKELAPQLGRRRIALEGFALGARRFTRGLAKKVLIADTVAITADAVFDVPATELTFAVAWLGLVAYALQIYFDFSGYSDMAIGIGQMIGFRLPENFNYPYIARSVTEFWRRWHITLSNWFRDYLYLPLGGNRRGKWKTYRNLCAVFLLCGLWHGAMPRFIVWGAIHGVFLVFERLLAGATRRRLPSLLRHVYVLSVVLFAWVFFRSETLSHATSMCASLIGMGPRDSWVHPFMMYVRPDVLMALVAGVAFSMPLRRWCAVRLDRTTESRPRIAPLLHGLRLVSFAALLWVSMMHVAGSTHSPFIYFRF